MTAQNKAQSTLNTLSTMTAVPAIAVGANGLGVIANVSPFGGTALLTWFSTPFLNFASLFSAYANYRNAQSKAGKAFAMAAGVSAAVGLAVFVPTITTASMGAVTLLAASTALAGVFNISSTVSSSRAARRAQTVARTEAPTAPAV